MIDKLYKIVKIVIGIFLAIFLGNKLFSFIPVYAYDFTDWKQPTQVVVEGLDGSDWYTFGTCSTGTLCGRTDYFGNLNRLQATYTYSQYFDTSKIYTITVASPFNNESCFKFGSEDISLRMTETPNGSSWYVTEIGQTSCVGQDGMSFYSFSFKPTRTNFTKFAISLNFSNQMLGPAADVRFSTKFNIVENENWDKVISQQNQTIINQNQTIINQGKETNEKLDQTNDNLNDLKEQEKETYDYLTDESEPNSDISSLGNVQGLLPPGPVDSLLNIPFKFLSVVNSSFGGVCKPLQGPFVFDSTLTLPCFSEVFYDEVPPLLLNFLSLIPAAWILISYFKHLYKKVNRAVSMETNADDEWGVL